MKKIFIVALMGLLGLTSCLGDGSKGDPTITGYSIYMDVNRQNVLALDPTNIAFRLNTLICEGKGDIQSVPDNIRRKLFSSGTTITYDEAKGSYDLVFNGSTITGDFARKGTVSVVTNGFDSLGMVGAQWGVLISSYSIFSGTDEIKFTCGDYTLSNMATNRWSVMASQVSTSVPSSSLSDYKSQWTGFYTIIQSSGTQGYESARKATYSVSTNVMNGITMYHPEDPMTISTPEPFQYNPQCSTTAPVGSGQMLISLDKDSNLENFTEVIILGTDLNTCYPKTRIKYNGAQNDYDIK